MGGFNTGSSSGGSSNQQNGDYDNNSTGSSRNDSNMESNSSSTPLTTNLWQQATGNAGNAVNAAGLTNLQQDATNFLQGTVQNQPMGWALQGLNGQLGQITGQPAPTISSPTTIGTSAITAPDAFTKMAPYAGLYSQNLIDPSLQQYDYGVQRALSSLDARTAAGGAFGNSRSGLAYGDLGTQAALGRGQLEAQLRGQGLQSALGAAQGDVASGLAASQANAANALQASSANAANQLATSRANQDPQLSMTDKALAALGLQAQNDVNTNTMGIGNAQSLYNLGGGGLTNLLNIAGSQVPAFGTSTMGSNSGYQTGSTDSTGTGTYSGSSSGYTTGSQSGLHMGK